MQLYLDCDNVLADFDGAATQLLRMPPRQFQKRHGLPEFWKRLTIHPDFYGSLPLTPGCDDPVRSGPAPSPDHPHRPAARDSGSAAESALAAQHFPGQRIITCLASDKRRHAHKGDILANDTLEYEAL